MNSLDVINKYLGVPFKHKGRYIEEGLDCYGLLICVYKDLGFKILDIEEYDESWSWKDKSLFIENYYREWDKVSLPSLFDGVLFKDGRGGVTHGGVMLSEDRFIHTCKGKGTIVSRVTEPIWANRLDGFFHLKARI